MFQFPASRLSYPMYSDKDNSPPDYWVPPFGYLRIITYVQLPVAFRRLLRPSSPLCAKAFTIRPLFLDLKCRFDYKLLTTFLLFLMSFLVFYLSTRWIDSLNLLIDLFYSSSSFL